MTELIKRAATDVVEDLRMGKLSTLELLDALEARIEAVEPTINALPVLCFDRAKEAAVKLAALPLQDRGLLCGLPVSIKDLTRVAGVRTTWGSRAFANHVPEVSDIGVTKLESEGGIVYAKSNTPEYGSGGHTFNDLFGTTRNPHDLSKSAAGSSGGAAASLAAGTSWLASGSDNGGSCRNPASFCNVVGLRPSPGRVARGPLRNPFQHLSVDGPMARNVQDLALFLDAMAGENVRDPLSLPLSGTSYLEQARHRLKPRKVAFSPDMGVTPVDPEVAAICEKAAEQFAQAGVPVEHAAPDLRGVKPHYSAIRAFNVAATVNHLNDEQRTMLKPEIQEEIRTAQSLSSDTLIEAVCAISKYRAHVAEFFAEYDLILTPATVVPPFPVEQRFPTECAGQKFDSYFDWLSIAYIFTFVSLPALSLPCGFTKSGLPVGLQMVTKHRSEDRLLSYALALEDMLGVDTGVVTPKGLPLKFPV